VIGGTLAGHAVPPVAASAIKSSVGGALEVAHRAPGAFGAALAAVARHGFVHGMELAMPLAAGVALAGALVVLAFLPARAGADPDADAESRPGAAGRELAVAGTGPARGPSEEATEEATEETTEEAPEEAPERVRIGVRR